MCSAEFGRGQHNLGGHLAGRGGGHVTQHPSTLHLFFRSLSSTASHFCRRLAGVKKSSVSSPAAGIFTYDTPTKQQSLCADAQRFAREVQRKLTPQPDGFLRLLRAGIR